MHGLVYGALVIAAIGTCVSAKLKIAMQSINFTTDEKERLCLDVCLIRSAYPATVSYHLAYPNLIANISAEDMFNHHCGREYASYDCLSKCRKSLNVDKKDESIFFVNQEIGSVRGIFRRTCFSLINQLSNIAKLTDCAHRLYPLVSDPKENMKCHKQCCSNPAKRSSIYSCSSIVDIWHKVLKGVTIDDSKDDLCKLGCVIGQAAQHSNGKCSAVLTKLLLFAQNDLSKIYPTLAELNDEHESHLQRAQEDPTETVFYRDATLTYPANTTEEGTPVNKFEMTAKYFVYRLDGYDHVYRVADWAN